MNSQRPPSSSQNAASSANYSFGFGPRRFSRRRGSRGTLRAKDGANKLDLVSTDKPPFSDRDAPLPATSHQSFFPRRLSARGSLRNSKKLEGSSRPLSRTRLHREHGVFQQVSDPLDNEADAVVTDTYPIPPSAISASGAPSLASTDIHFDDIDADPSQNISQPSSITDSYPTNGASVLHGSLPPISAPASASVPPSQHHHHHYHQQHHSHHHRQLLQQDRQAVAHPNYHPHQRQHATVSSHANPNPLALLAKLQVLAEGLVFVSQHGGTFKSRLFRKNPIHRYAEARGRVVILRDEQGGGVHEVFSPIGCAVSVADTVVTKKGAVEHNVNIAKAGHTVQMRFPSETQAEHWAEVLASMAAGRVPRLSDFEVLAPIGEGASGKVFLVRDRKTCRKLALKCMNKSVSALASNSSDSRHAIDERVTHEVMNGSQYIVGLRHAFQTQSKLYIATEFCDGGDVYNYVDSRGGGVNEAQARIITAQVVLGLKKLHDANIIFRDLKPENVLITGDGRVRLADFGLCKQFDNSNAITRTVCGTFSYAAAEILMGDGYGRSCDLWALGVFLYHIMIGRPPRVSASVHEAKANIFESKEPIIWYSDVMSEHAMSLVTALIEVDSSRRLGCGPAGIAEICDHPFFKEIDWLRLADGDVPVDIKESLPSPELGDLRNFNQEEWASIEMDEDYDSPVYMESSLWPIRNLVTHPLPSDFVVSYSYSAETMTKGGRSVV